MPASSCMMLLPLHFENSFLIFANQWNEGTPENGSDIDIYDYAYKTTTRRTIYWTGGSYRGNYNLAWGTTANVPRKWFFVKVQEVK